MNREQLTDTTSSRGSGVGSGLDGSYVTANEGRYQARTNAVPADKLYVGGDGDPAYGTYISLASWQAQGWDEHSFVAVKDDLFVDAGADDYQLKASSPAIDAGTTLADVTDDIAGNSRPAGAAYDIGAYEYGGTPMATMPVISPPGGTYGPSVSVTITSETPGATIASRWVSRLRNTRRVSPWVVISAVLLRWV